MVRSTVGVAAIRPSRLALRRVAAWASTCRAIASQRATIACPAAGVSTRW